jgi:acyl-CoA reductase-like NAD-dependent aldehyde dehydrogenase
MHLPSLFREEEAIKVAKDKDYTLCAGVFTDRSGQLPYQRTNVYIQPPIPNGDIGDKSGYGRSGGIAAVEEFTKGKMLTPDKLE